VANLGDTMSATQGGSGWTCRKSLAFHPSLSWSDLTWRRARSQCRSCSRKFSIPRVPWRCLLSLTLAAARQVCLSFVIDVGSIVGDIRPHHREGGLPAGIDTLRIHAGVMGDGRVPRVVDTIISGDVYHSHGLLRRLIALAIDFDMRWVGPEQIRSHLGELLQAEGSRSDRSLIVLVDGDDVYAYLQEGPRSISPHCPRPTRRSRFRFRFPIFIDAASGKVQWTAHVMVSKRLNSSAASSEAGRATHKAASVVSACWMRVGATVLFGPDHHHDERPDRRETDRRREPNILTCPNDSSLVRPNDGKVIADEW
jgi:hypothetical protein